MSATTQTDISTSAARTSFISNRLGSLLAIAPLGVWVLVHLWNNLAAFGGASDWERSVTEFKHPLLQGVTWAIVLVPLIWHAVWGTKRTIEERPNYPRYGYFANLRFILQRASAIGLGAFLAAHLWLAFIKPRFVVGAPESFADLASQMRHHLPTLAVYALGILAVAYHFANGLHAAAMGWGVAVSRTALRRMQLGVWVLFVLLLAMGWGAIYALWLAGGVATMPASPG